MTWNYRVVRFKNGSLGLYEVYYRADGKPSMRTENPCGFSVDAEEGLDGLLKSLRLALRDAEERPILDEPDEWAEPKTEEE